MEKRKHLDVPETKLLVGNKKVLKILKGNPEFYNRRINAINTLFLVSDNYQLLQFESGSGKLYFDDCLNELKKAILIEKTEVFAQEFAKVTFKIVSSLKKSIQH